MIKGTSNAYKRFVDQNLSHLVKILGSCLQFEKWGFKQSFHGVVEEYTPTIIYDSDKCRVRFCLIVDSFIDHDTERLEIRYGRLHASNQERFMLWNGVNCHCWHSLHNTLKFLDGLSPQEAVKKSQDFPQFIRQFAQQIKGDACSDVIWVARLHSAVWENYGAQLFDLFDLRHPDLWEQYKQFLTEFYQFQAPHPNPYAPPRENIC